MIKLLAFVLLFPFVLSGPSMAKEPTENLNVFFVENRDGEPKFRPDVEALLWKLPEEIAKDEKEKETLHTLSVEEVEMKLGKPLLEGVSNERGLWKLENLDSPGVYYVRERAKEGSLVAVPTVFELPHKEGTIYIKAMLPKEPTGGRLFYKVDGVTKKPLGNAIFQVTALNKEGKWEHVLRDGKRYTISSEKNGNLFVSDLPYGTYSLLEIEAPAGYQKADKPISFEISATSEFEKAVLIKNMPNTPPKIQIPKTGDLVLYLLLIGGVILVALGYHISRKASQ